jgi:hypothetical protein
MSARCSSWWVFLVAFSGALVVPAPAVAQTPPVDLATGYRFDFDDCAAAKKKKDPPWCSHNEHVYTLNDGVLRVDWSQPSTTPGRNRGSVSTVPVKSLSWTDHTVAQDPNGFDDAGLVHHDLWHLKLETSSHRPDVHTDSQSELLGPSESSSYLLTLTFPTREEAEAAWTQISAAKDKSP